MSNSKQITSIYLEKKHLKYITDNKWGVSRYIRDLIEEDMKDGEI